MSEILDFILHIDEHLRLMIQDYGVWVYVILFLIVFVETGLIVMPLLPGDSLLFAAGAIAAAGNNEGLNIWYLMPLLILAALCGDNVNYFTGRFFSDQIKKRNRILFFKREYIDKTEAFYAKHGKQAIIMARFVPIVRTIAPFVAGAGRMPYMMYLTYCIMGAFLWVIGVGMLGYIFGNVPIVKDHFEKVVFLIIFISILPIILAVFRSKSKKNE
jgi:membrane-associated protein